MYPLKGPFAEGLSLPLERENTAKDDFFPDPYLNLTPEIFYVPVTVKKVGPPYGKAYGHYKKYRPNKEWKKVILNDYEVIDLVNLRFISEHYQLKPEVVMEMRGRGKSFVTINQESWDKKEKMKGKLRKENKKQVGKGKGRTKIKKHS